MIVGKRPRQLHWYHAGPMLFGDWGTSRLYVLGICFALTRHASVWFMLAMSLVLIGVGWAYSVVCRLYPDGGGVYSSAKHKSQFLAVVGALLLCADYVVTAAMSAVEAFHYLGLHHPEWWAAGGIAALTVVNIFGPTKSGLFAIIAAVLTIIASLVVGVAAVPHIGAAHIEMPTGSIFSWWGQFTAIILAISGVEAIANMTGIMVEPVEKTARKAIWPVLVEIVVLNLVLTLAMSAVPLEVLGNGDPAMAYTAHQNDMLNLLASYYVSPTFAKGASFVFAMLLLSAVNTSITAIVSVQYMMAQDREFPAIFSKLNFWGMPKWPLLVAMLVPLATVILVPDVMHLADLYAIGVVGAVAVNLGSCALSFDLPIRRWERIGIGAIAILMTAIWFTIAYEKPHALVFAGSIVLVGLSVRWLAQHPAVFGEVYRRAEAAVTGLLEGSVAGQYEPKTRFLTATRGNPKLLNFALDQSKRHEAELLVLFVKQVAVPLWGPAMQIRAEDDQEAIKVFEDVKKRAAEAGVPIRTLYAVTNDVADVIVDFAATHGVERVILGATQRGSLWRTMKGDVISGVATHLPERTQLLICA